MHEEIIISGFGGQGVLLAGKLLCIAAMREGKYVSHIPSYGAEMRGGTANCKVIISDEEISSPVIDHPTIVIALNTPSMHKFEPKMVTNGLMLFNSSLISDKPTRTDIKVKSVKANDISEAAGSLRAANMAALGYLLKVKPEIASMDALKHALDEAISERNKQHNPVNIQIMEAGYQS
ncbi:MAG: 2-oxoacid:acceptor oxidoreductase family protein [Spirochaetaceae bacterium]|nr:2-oxoacid:acceptor oxidoreductase family protein [Spirochaetaceae bacterium]